MTNRVVDSTPIARHIVKPGAYLPYLDRKISSRTSPFIHENRLFRIIKRSICQKFHSFPCHIKVR